MLKNCNAHVVLPYVKSFICSVTTVTKILPSLMKGVDKNFAVFLHYWYIFFSHHLGK